MRALSQIAARTGKQIDTDDLRDIVIWGNHSATQYPDTHFAKIGEASVRDVVGDAEWLDGEFVTKVAKRGAEIISVMGKSSAASAAAAACEHMHDWWCGNQNGGWVSMAVINEGGAYGIDKDLCFSMPCNVSPDGEVSVVADLTLNEFQQSKLKASEAELLEERKMALDR